MREEKTQKQIFKKIIKGVCAEIRRRVGKAWLK